MQQRDAGAGQYEVEDIELHQEWRAAQHMDIQPEQLVQAAHPVTADHADDEAQQRTGDDRHERDLQGLPEALDQERQHDAGGGQVGIQHAHLAFQAGPASHRLTPRDSSSITA